MAAGMHRVHHREDLKEDLREDLKEEEAEARDPAEGEGAYVAQDPKAVATKMDNTTRACNK